MVKTPLISAKLKSLRQQVRAIEGFRCSPDSILSLGVAEIDQALPWGGLPLFCLHHVVGGNDHRGCSGFAPPATTFTAGLAVRLKEHSKETSTVVWCLPRYQTADMIYGPALAMLGLDESALIIARAKNQTEALWVMEEALGCADVTTAISALTAPISMAAERRLQLAAERGRTTGFLLQSDLTVAASSVAVTRWTVSALSSAATVWSGLGRPRWSLSLDRCRQGNSHSWIVEWCDETRNLYLATPLHHRSIDQVTVERVLAPICSVA